MDRRTRSTPKIWSRHSQPTTDVPYHWILGWLIPHLTCPQCPIWGRRQPNLHQECSVCSYNNKEPGLSWPDSWIKHASSLQRWTMLRSWSERRSDVHPWLSRNEISNVCQGLESQHQHRVVAQEDRPHQSPEAQGNAVERTRHRTSDFY